jgi:hypothetical protein
MGAEVDATTFTREARKQHREKVRKGLDVLARMLNESRFDFERPMVGLEIELNLVDDELQPAMRNAEVLKAIADPSFQTELGRFNIEVNVAPRRLVGGGFSSFEQSVRKSLNDADPRAQQVGCKLVMIGILPTLRAEHVSRSSPRAERTWRSSSTGSSGCTWSRTRSCPRLPAPRPRCTCK